MTATQVSLAPRDKVSSRATRISLKKNSFDICVRFVNIRKFIQKTGLKSIKTCWRILPAIHRAQPKVVGDVKHRRDIKYRCRLCQKRCKIEIQLQCTPIKKSYILYRITRTPMSLNELEGNFSVSKPL